MLRKGKTILIAEDEEAIIQLLQAIFEAQGFRVELAYDGEEALEKVFSFKPDLLILDVLMPRKDGWEVLSELRENEQTKDLPIVMLTVEGSPKSILRGWREGADCYIPKPFDPDELISVVKRILEVS